MNTDAILLKIFHLYMTSLLLRIITPNLILINKTLYIVTNIISYTLMLIVLLLVIYYVRLRNQASKQEAENKEDIIEEQNVDNTNKENS